MKDRDKCGGPPNTWGDNTNEVFMILPHHVDSATWINDPFEHTEAIKDEREPDI